MLTKSSYLDGSIDQSNTGPPSTRNTKNKKGDRIDEKTEEEERSS